MNGHDVILSQARKHLSTCPADWQPTPGQKGAITGVMNTSLGGDANRKTVLAAVFPGASGSKSLTTPQWWTLWNWTGTHKDETSGWQADPAFVLDALVLLKYATITSC